MRFIDTTEWSEAKELICGVRCHCLEHRVFDGCPVYTKTCRHTVHECRVLDHELCRRADDEPKDRQTLVDQQPPEVPQPAQAARMLEELQAWLPAVYAEVMGKLPRTTREDLAAYVARSEAAMRRGK